MESKGQSVESLIARVILNSPQFIAMVESMVNAKIDYMNLDKQYYTPEEVASMLKIKKQTVYAHVKKGLLKPIRAGLSMRFTQMAIDEYLKR